MEGTTHLVADHVALPQVRTHVRAVGTHNPCNLVLTPVDDDSTIEEVGAEYNPARHLTGSGDRIPALAEAGLSLGRQRVLVAISAGPGMRHVAIHFVAPSTAATARLKSRSSVVVNNWPAAVSLR